MPTDSEYLSTVVERELTRMGSRVSSLLSGTGTEHLHSRALLQTGKLLRPRILFLVAQHAADACGSTVDWECAGQSALAIELAHVGTLYHDDVVDRSSTRRGHPAVYREHGTVAASYGGAHLLVLANRLAAELPDQMLRAWARAATRVADGQTRELDNTGDINIEPEAYVRVARKKTGSLFQLAAQLGSQCGGVTTGREFDSLSQFGLSFGTSFQLFDDLADFSRPTDRHREARTDLRNRTYTLPVLYGLNRDQGHVLHSLLRNDGNVLGDAIVDLVCERLRDGLDFERAEKRAHLECDSAATSLCALGSTVARARLLEMVDVARSEGRFSRRAA